MQKVVDNVQKGLKKLKVDFALNARLTGRDEKLKVISFGLGAKGLEGVSPGTPLIAAIGFPYPSELPRLCVDYNVVKYLQHSEWALKLTSSSGVYDPKIFDLWFAGVDTDEWFPMGSAQDKTVDVLLYIKIHWELEKWLISLIEPIKRYLKKRNLTTCELVYGTYDNDKFQILLSKSKSMIFLSPHETQGLAYQECLASDVPVLAWDPGYWMDPVRFKYGRDMVRSTSIPFFDARCGRRFSGYEDFVNEFETFFDSAVGGCYSPRDYIVENLSIEKSTRRLIEIYEKDS